MALELGGPNSTHPSILLESALRNALYAIQNKDPGCFRNGYCLLPVVYRLKLSQNLPQESSMSILRCISCAAVLFAITAVTQCDAQVLYGSLTGNVTDPASV